MKSSWWYCGLVLLLFCVVSVYAEGFEPTDNEDIRSLKRQSQIKHGREIWFKNTYGGEKFFDILATEGVQIGSRKVIIRVGFENVITTPRNKRFQTWGTINDPDCTANPKEGEPDICLNDPHATGVIGIRQFESNGRTIFGTSCASCHVGFNPLNPPTDVNEPEWDNLHPTIGSPHLKSGKITAANLPPTDPLRLMFEAWPDGTVDTTALFNDNVMNPSVITAIWGLRHRPTFDVGLDEPKIRMGLGGEDDLGGERAALRVYTNIGVCFSECIKQPLADGTPIDLEQCRASDCLPPEQDINDLVKFLRSIKAPKFPERSPDPYLFVQGREVFKENCSSCHTLKGRAERVLSNDEVTLFVEDLNPLKDPVNTTNACRALTSQWQEDHLWAEFSSQVYKDRAAAHGKGYRTVPLTGIWATAPFLHNQSVGPIPPANASPEERAQAYEAAMRELLLLSRQPKINTLPVQVGPFPPGTPLTFVFSRDPTTGEVLCDDIVENRGHHYGAELPDEDKEALVFWLRQQ
jgi:cytochrome c5